MTTFLWQLSHIMSPKAILKCFWVLFWSPNNYAFPTRVFSFLGTFVTIVSYKMSLTDIMMLFECYCGVPMTILPFSFRTILRLFYIYCLFKKKVCTKLSPQKYTRAMYLFIICWFLGRACVPPLYNLAPSLLKWLYMSDLKQQVSGMNWLTIYPFGTVLSFRGTVVTLHLHLARLITRTLALPIR